MVLEDDGICLEYRVLKASCNLLLNIWSIPFCHPDLYSGSPWKLQVLWQPQYILVSKTPDQLQHSSPRIPQINGTWKFQRELLILKARLSAQKTPVGTTGWPIKSIRGSSLWVLAIHSRAYSGAQMTVFAEWKLPCCGIIKISTLAVIPLAFGVHLRNIARYINVARENTCL